MNSPSASIPFEYRQPVWGQFDRALKNCFRAAGIFGLLVLVTVFVVPKPIEHMLSLDEVPERFAKLIIEKPKAPVAAPPAPDQIAQMETPKVDEPSKVETPKPDSRPKPSTRQRTKPKPVDPDAGRKGREVATAQVTKNLENVQGSLDKALENLSASLPAAEAGSSKDGSRRRRSRTVRGGKDGSQIGAVSGVQTTDAQDVSGSGLASNGISIATISDLGGDGVGESSGGGGSIEGGSSGGGGEFRSNSSLLAVVRRYAAGIQFCYDNQLKKQPGLRGEARREPHCSGEWLGE